MGTHAILAVYKPNKTISNIVWEGVVVSFDGTPEVVIPSLIQLRNLRGNMHETLDYLIFNRPGGWHSVYQVNWSLTPILFNTISHNNEWWSAYMEKSQKDRAPIAHSDEPQLRF